MPESLSARGTSVQSARHVPCITPRGAALSALLLLWAGPSSGCTAAQRPIAASPPATGHPQPSHTQRLAWIVWQADAVVACGRHTLDLRAPGTLTGCVKVPTRHDSDRRTAAPIAPASIDGAQPDRRPLDSVPGAKRDTCWIEAQDSVATHAPTAARLLLHGRRTDLVLDEWVPAVQEIGDYYAVEASFSADGKTLALLRVSVERGDDGLDITLRRIILRSPPGCPQ